MRISGLTTTIYDKSVEEIENAFLKAYEQQRRCLVLFFPFGFPDIDASIEIINSLSQTADVLEIGIPFSDPVADGVLIQEAYENAIERGAGLPVFFENLDKLKLKSVSLMMSYLNPVVQAGVERVSQMVFKAGIRGFVFPDLPVEEKMRWFSRRKNTGCRLFCLLRLRIQRKGLLSLQRRQKVFSILSLRSGLRALEIK